MSVKEVLDKLVEECHGTSRSKGWWDEEVVRDVIIPHNIPEKLMLITSEAAEALEEYRVGHMDTYYTKAQYSDLLKPEGFPSELADIVIRVFDLCGHLGIDIAAEMETKMAFNKTRPHRHGNKRC